MAKISELFDVKYGVNLELNKLELDINGVNFDALAKSQKQTVFKFVTC